MRKRTRTIALLLATASIASPVFPDVALAQQPAAAEPSEQQIQMAQTHFKKGSDFFAAKKYALALDEFKKSYGAVASPNSHLYIARSLAALSELRDAYLEFDLVIAEAAARSVAEPKYAPTRDTAQLERDELAAKLALVTVKVTGDSPDSKLQIAGKEVPRERWGKPYPVAPGATDIVLVTPSKTPAKQTITFAAGEKRDVAVNALSHTPPGPRGGDTTSPEDGTTTGTGTGTDTGKTGSTNLRPFAFVAAGVGVVGFGLFAVGGILSNSTYSNLEEKCQNGPCPTELAGDVSAGKTQQTLANVGLIVGAVGIAAAVLSSS